MKGGYIVEEDDVEYDEISKSLERGRKKGVKDLNKLKEGNIMKGRSDIKKKSNGKTSVITELNIKPGLNNKVKKALKQSIYDEIEKKIAIKGSGLKNIELEFSDSDGESENEDIIGLGLKKKKKKAIKNIIEKSLIDFSKPSNTSLNQYLEATKKKQKDLVEKKQTEITNKLLKYLN